jgi:hypothetical protein
LAQKECPNSAIRQRSWRGVSGDFDSRRIRLN